MVGPIWCLVWGTRAGLLGTLAGFVLLAVLSASAITDVRRQKIYNWATYPAIVWALVINLAPSYAALGAVGLGDCLGGAALCFFMTFIGYDLSGGGAGDVKLATAIGALLGVQHGVIAIALSYIVAGLGIVAIITWVNGPFVLLKTGSRAAGSLLGRWWPLPLTTQDIALLTRPVALGPYFAIGSLLTVLGIVHFSAFLN